MLTLIATCRIFIMCIEAASRSQPCVPLSAHKLILCRIHLHDVFVPESALPKLGLIATQINSPVINHNSSAHASSYSATPFSLHRIIDTHTQNVTRPADHPGSRTISPSAPSTCDRGAKILAPLTAIALPSARRETMPAILWVLLGN